MIKRDDRRSKTSNHTQEADRWLILFACLSLFLLLLLWLVDWALPGSLSSFETAILEGLRHPDDPSDPLGAHWVEEAVRDITALGGIGVLILIIVVSGSYLIVRGAWRLGVVTMLAIVSGMMINVVLKSVINRPRPMVVPQQMYVASASFPSGHSMLSAVTFLTIAVMLARRQQHEAARKFIVLSGIGITVLVGLSRLYLGVHWPTDVLAGWLIGALWTMVWLHIADRYA